MFGTQNRISWPIVSSDIWRDMHPVNGERDRAEQRHWTPAAFVTESDTEFTLRLDIPGVNSGTLEVDLGGEYLSITGERPAPSMDETRKILVSEGLWGRFHRRFRMGPGLNREGITADYRDGVLEITVPKREEARPRRIAVSTEA